MVAESISRSNDNPADIRNREVVHPDTDPFSANLATPINASGFAKAYFSALPAYRKGISMFRRGLEVGVAHGYWLIGPFVAAGPLRGTDAANQVGLLSTLSVLFVSTVAIWLYGASKPHPPVTAIAPFYPPSEFNTSEGWKTYGNGFLAGGIIGALIAYFLLANFSGIINILNL